MTRTGNKITLVNIKFSLNACKKISKREIDCSSDTARGFFTLFNYLEKLKVRDFVDIWVMEDQIQDLVLTCGIFQICFYNNLFNPDVNIQILTCRNFTEQIICFG